MNYTNPHFASRRAIFSFWSFFIRLGVLLILAFFILSPAAFAAEPADFVNPFIGTGGHGHTYPGATVPFGLVQLSPDTRIDDWDACAGYHFSDHTIMGFSHTHLSGTGIREYGDLLILPMTGELPSSANPIRHLRENYLIYPMNDEVTPSLDTRRFVSGFSHDREAAEPGYYRVLLDKYKVLAELTATAHAGMHRYTFPASSQSHILIDLVHGLANTPVDAALDCTNGNLILGHRRSDGWAKGIVIYFAIETSQPWKSMGLELGEKLLPAGITTASGKRIRAHLDFETSTNQPILLRVGLSPTSTAEALKNLRAEIPNWDFDAVRQAARAEWNRQLSHLEIETPNPNLRQTFYTALYHSMLAPTLYSDADGSYRGPSGATHTNAGFQFYSTFSLWDTFRAEHPLLTVIQPQRVNDFIQTFLASYQESPAHLLPVWPLGAYETGSMIGYHSVPVIWDAYQKGFRGYDAQFALHAMRDTALNPRNDPGEYEKLGYMPVATGSRKAGAARTLEYCYDDWCIAEMARALGQTNDANLFTKRSEFFTNIFDPGTKFFRGKTVNGSFHEPFDPRLVTFEDYVEANAWQYTFAVFHDVPEMISLYGGNAAFIKKLDELFDQDSEIHHYIVDISGLIGQYAHGNEPCHHVAYLYALAGAQYKTALRAHQIMQLYYDNTPEGICGNDDCGQMSAWYVWSAMGLYPLNPANGIYVLGSPMVQKATIRLDPAYYSGKTFTIEAPNASIQNIYIQSASLNGELLTHPWITHEQLAKGGTLKLEMGILPNKSFGAMN